MGRAELTPINTQDWFNWQSWRGDDWLAQHVTAGVNSKQTMHLLQKMTHKKETRQRILGLINWQLKEGHHISQRNLFFSMFFVSKVSALCHSDRCCETVSLSRKISTV